MSSNTSYTVPIAIIIAGALVAGAVLYTGGESANTADSGPQHNAEENGMEGTVSDVDTAGEPFIGKPDAPVTMVYWLDFQCPFCKRFETQTLPTLIDDYVKTGEVKVVFKDFQFIGDDSQTAGVAAGAIWDLYPDQYFDWQTALFERQDGENSGFGGREDVLMVAEEIDGINADEVAARMDEKRQQYLEEQQADRQEAQRFGVQGTPGFVIGSQSLSGAQPISVFRQLIDSQLN